MPYNDQLHSVHFRVVSSSAHTHLFMCHVIQLASILLAQELSANPRPHFANQTTVPVRNKWWKCSFLYAIVLLDIVHSWNPLVSFRSASCEMQLLASLICNCNGGNCGNCVSHVYGNLPPTPMCPNTCYSHTYIPRCTVCYYRKIQACCDVQWVLWYIIAITGRDVWLLHNRGMHKCAVCCAY